MRFTVDTDGYGEPTIFAITQDNPEQLVALLRKSDLAPEKPRDLLWNLICGVARLRRSGPLTRGEALDLLTVVVGDCGLVIRTIGVHNPESTVLGGICGHLYRDGRQASADDARAVFGALGCEDSIRKHAFGVTTVTGFIPPFACKLTLFTDLDLPAGALPAHLLAEVPGSSL